MTPVDRGRFSTRESLAGGRWLLAITGPPLVPHLDARGHHPRSNAIHTMHQNDRNDFTCIQCRSHIPAQAFGTKHRNHCPLCLWSRHVDEEPGDRASPCRAAMAPTAIEVRRDGEWAIIHRCTACGVLKANRIAGDDQERTLLALSLRPLANPAFPLDNWR